jgi:hypothetical protein
MHSIRDNITFIFWIIFVCLKKQTLQFQFCDGVCLVVLQRQGRSSVPTASSVATIGLDLQTDRIRKT